MSVRVSMSRLVEFGLLRAHVFERAHELAETR